MCLMLMVLLVVLFVMLLVEVWAHREARWAQTHCTKGPAPSTCKAFVLCEITWEFKTCTRLFFKFSPRKKKIFCVTTVIEHSTGLIPLALLFPILFSSHLISLVQYTDSDYSLFSLPNLRRQTEALCRDVSSRLPSSLAHWTSLQSHACPENRRRARQNLQPMCWRHQSVNQKKKKNRNFERKREYAWKFLNISGWEKTWNEHHKYYTTEKVIMQELLKFRLCALVFQG